MQEYTPDVWVVIKITSPKHGTHHRVLCGWYGGYLGSDNWRINSGITKVEMDGDFIVFFGNSESIYRCHKNAERLSAMTHSVLAHYEKEAEEKGDGHSVEVVPFNRYYSN